MEFANRTQLTFDPAPAVFAVDSVGTDLYATPLALQESLGDLARLTYTRAKLAGVVKLDASATTTVTVRLTDGATDYATAAVAITAGTVGYFELVDIDLSAVRGSTRLRIAVDVTVAGASGNGQVWAKLTLEHPVVIAG